MAKQDRTTEYLFNPPQNAKDLYDYIDTWMDIQLPWDSVDERSTSSPFGFVWDVYNKLLTDKGADSHTVAVARNSMKTLGCAVIQFLGLVLFRRDGNHLAATLDQSAAMISYIDKLLGIPELKPYRVKDNVKQKGLHHLPPNSYTTKDSAKLLVVTASKKGANSSRASLATIDEFELIPEDIITEFAFVLDPTRDGRKREPVSIQLSSRKFATGPMQKRIEELEKSGATNEEKLHKWSAVDMMSECPDSLHKPELGKRTAYIHTDLLQVIWKPEDPAELERWGFKPDSNYLEISAFEGCKTCPAFIACQGRSAKQKAVSNSLRTPAFVGKILREAKSDTNKIKSQFLNWEPSNEALVFRTFNFHQHIKDPREFYRWATFGENFNPGNRYSEKTLKEIEEGNDLSKMIAILPTKADIYRAMVKSGWVFVGGVDWGFTDPATILITGWHKKTKQACVLHYEQAHQYANFAWADHVCLNVLPLYPVDTVAPDMADPASPTYFAKHGVPSLDTKPSKIETGVSFTRGLLWSPVTQRSSFAILNDSIWCQENNNMIVVDSFRGWTHRKMADGSFDMTKFEDDDYCHAQDSLRYALAQFVEEREVSYSFSTASTEANLKAKFAHKDPEAIEIYKQKQEVTNQLQEHFAKEFGITLKADPKAEEKQKKTTSKSSVKFRF